jgi:hydrogenase/urease accessory protein HupE
MQKMRFGLIVTAIAFLLVAGAPRSVCAHPLVENALDVVISRNGIVIVARISREQIQVVDGASGAIPSDKFLNIARGQAGYVRDHLRVRVDGKDVSAKSATLIEGEPLSGESTALVPYRVEYALESKPTTVQVDQTFLREIPLWTASCVLRIRQADQGEWDTDLLTREKTAEFGCDWTASASRPTTMSTAGSAPTITAQVRLGPTIRAYVQHGIMHILTGYDHMLFITALVLATTKLWDLIKVVTAFTIAHTLTLALSVFNVVTISEHVVEPMIAMSIIFVAVQNIFWPERSRGWSRLAVAFAFGLFHGLGFAGGLKDAMVGMPGVALWAALISFSVGVEIAHQMVVIPAYGVLTALRGWKTDQPRLWLSAKTRQFGSAGISVAGIYFLVQAIRM